MSVNKIKITDRQGNVLSEDVLTPITSVSATIDNNTGTPEVSADYADGGLSLSFSNMKGEVGPQGIQGLQGDSAVYDPDDPNVPDFEMANTTGQSTTKAMTQKAVTDEMYKRLDKGSDDSENILNVTDESGNILACFNKDGEMLFKRIKKLDARWQNFNPTNSATDFKGCYYNGEGKLMSLGVNSIASYFGTAKIDVTGYRGKTLYILTNVSGNGYNMFKASDGSIIEEWQQSSVVAKVVPDDAELLLLTNLFYYANMTPAVTEPYVYYNDALQLLIEQKEDDGQFDKSENILNLIDEDGNILAYFDKQGILRAKFPDNLEGEFEINLPDSINSYVGDTLQLFKYPITFLGDYANYGVNLSIRTNDNNVRKNGKTLRRYFEFTPQTVGTYTIDVNVMNTRLLRVLAEKVLTINVLNPTNPQNVVNVLCVGDSETEGYVNNSDYTAVDGSVKATRSPYTDELKARLTTNRTATNTLPAGLGLSNIHLIGTRNTSGGRHEGYGGWGVDDFLKSGSPFWKNGAVDYNAYLAQNSVYDDTTNKGVDIIYILLGANHTTPFNPKNGTFDTSDYEGKIKTMLNGINAQLRTDENADFYNPNLKVVLLNYYSPYIEGRGYHPFGSSKYGDNCLNAKLYMEYYKTNCRVAALDDYAEWVESIMLAPEIDSENSFVYMNKQKNVYMSETEINSLEAVHPNSIAYKMIGAAVMRDLIGRI